MVKTTLQSAVFSNRRGRPHNMRHSLPPSLSSSRRNKTGILILAPLTSHMASDPDILSTSSAPIILLWNSALLGEIDKIVRCDSSGTLYPLQLPTSALLASTSSLWHPGHEVLSKLAHSSAISCNKRVRDSLCHTCQLGRHVRLPFHASLSRALCPFELLHCDLWTSPITSVSGRKYYIVILDDFPTISGSFPCV
jgi:hypothetical protein